MSSIDARDDLISGVTNTPCGYGQWTDNSAARNLASATGHNAATKRLNSGMAGRPNKALIQCTAQAIRWTDDGSTPTALLGLLLAVGATLEYDGDLSRFQWIEVAASAVVNISFYRG